MELVWYAIKINGRYFKSSGGGILFFPTAQMAYEECGDIIAEDGYELVKVRQQIINDA